jgi:hypothetical protein
MKQSLTRLAIAMLFATSLNSLACQPILKVEEPSLNEAKRNFDEATFVVIAEVVGVQTLTRVSTFDIEFPVERATFRVERAFKGALKSGATF